MKKDVLQAKPVYEKPTVEVLGSLARLTQWGINPNKWSSLSDLEQGIGTAIADGGIGS